MVFRGHVTIRTVLAQGIKSGKRVFLLRRFDRAAPRNLFANFSAQRVPNSNSASRRTPGAIYFYWQVRRGEPGGPKANRMAP